MLRRCQIVATAPAIPPIQRSVPTQTLAVASRFQRGLIRFLFQYPTAARVYSGELIATSLKPKAQRFRSNHLKRFVEVLIVVGDHPAHRFEIRHRRLTVLTRWFAEQILIIVTMS